MMIICGLLFKDFWSIISKAYDLSFWYDCRMCLRNDVYKKILQKRFHKTSLSLLDLFFKIYLLELKRWGQKVEKVWVW